MKKQIRASVFETNSSMSHTLQMMSKKDYEEFMKHEEDEDWAWSFWHDKWVRVNSDEYDEDCDGSYFDEEADYNIEEFTTEHGDVVVAISKAKEDY